MNKDGCKKTPPVNCEWNSWSSGSCSKTCGKGVLTYTRSKRVTENDKGSCSGSSTKTEDCHKKDCPGNLFLLLKKF